MVVAPQLGKQRRVWVIASLFLVFHGVLSVFLPEKLNPLSTICIVVAELAVILAALRVSRRVESPTRILWWLLATAIAFHCTAMTLDAIREANGAPVFNYVPGLSVFFSMLYGVPLLVAVSMQLDSRILGAAKVTNAILSLAIGLLLYLQILSMLTLQGSRNLADAVLISHLFDGIDLFLAAAATIRWFGSDSGPERGFFRVAMLFLWLNTLLPGIHNRILMRYDYVWLDLFISTPYVVLFVLIVTKQQERAQAVPANVAHFVRSGSAILLSVALLVIGVITARTHFYLGLGAALLAIVAYGIVSTLAQSKGREVEESLLTSKEVLEGLVGIDSLTGIANRWAFDQALKRECAIARRTASAVSLVMIDIDHFKLINDTQGHQAGDHCLIQIAGALSTALPRESDLVARYGGEEFAAILPATDRCGAEETARKISVTVEELKISHPASPFGIVTISIGLSTYKGTAERASADLVSAADRALYLAKRGGRNRFESLSIEAISLGPAIPGAQTASVNDGCTTR